MKLAIASGACTLLAMALTFGAQALIPLPEAPDYDGRIAALGRRMWWNKIGIALAVFALALSVLGMVLHSGAAEAGP